MRVIVLPLLAVLLHADCFAGDPDEVSLCGPEEATVFSCGVSDSEVVSICGRMTPTNVSGFMIPTLDALQFRFGPKDKPRILFPKTYAPLSEAFKVGETYSNDRPGGGVYLLFQDRRDTYRVFHRVLDYGRWDDSGMEISKANKRPQLLLCQTPVIASPMMNLTSLLKVGFRRDTETRNHVP